MLNELLLLFIDKSSLEYCLDDLSVGVTDSSLNELLWLSAEPLVSVLVPDGEGVEESCDRLREVLKLVLLREYPPVEVDDVFE